VRRVIVESPYAGKNLQERARNVRYARACLRDCLLRGEAPFASHLLYTQLGVLDDDDQEERELGITMGLAWGSAADATICYTDLGTSQGMRFGMADAGRQGRPVEFRSLGPNWDIYRHDWAGSEPQE